MYFLQWGPVMWSGSKYWKLLRIVCKWWKRSENGPNVRSSELDHITGPFSASWAPVLAQNYCLSFFNPLCAATATCSTRYTVHSCPVCQGVVFSSACILEFLSRNILYSSLPGFYHLLHCRLVVHCTLYKHPVTLTRYFALNPQYLTNYWVKNNRYPPFSLNIEREKKTIGIHRFHVKNIVRAHHWWGQFENTRAVGCKGWHMFRNN